MLSGDELYDDDVTSGVIDPPKPSIRLWDRLSPSERGALTRQWQEFASALLRLDKVSTVPSRLIDAWQGSLDVELIARKRQLYLNGLVQTWHRLSFADKSLGEARIPDEAYGTADLDHLLWETHPGNLLDILEEAA